MWPAKFLKAWTVPQLNQPPCGFAALKFLEDRFQESVSEVGAVGIRKEHKAIEPEDVECVREFLEGGIDIGQREAGETSEAVGSRTNEFG
jgi:hypothetical protein